MARVTPMRRQYLEIKSQYPDCILMFRMGDFYEMFDEDAEMAARELDITLDIARASQRRRKDSHGGRALSLGGRLHRPLDRKGLSRRGLRSRFLSRPGAASSSAK